MPLRQAFAAVVIAWCFDQAGLCDLPDALKYKNKGKNDKDQRT